MVVKMEELVVNMEIEGPVSVRLVHSACLGKHDMARVLERSAYL